MATLQVYLIPRFSTSYFDFGEGAMYVTGLYLKEYLDQVCANLSGFSGSDFHWEVGSASAIQDTDLVCYVLRDAAASIVQKHTSDALGAGGSTVWSTRSHAMISEVYMTAIEGDASRYRLLANLVFHELMHNKLDAHPSLAVLSDVHAISGGSVSKVPVNSSKRPSKADIAKMRLGVPKKIKQYTGAI
jgi:hypothetical protein